MLMGLFRKTHKDTNGATNDTTDESVILKKNADNVTRNEFHKMAEENLREMLLEDTQAEVSDICEPCETTDKVCETTTDDADSINIANNEDDYMDDFSLEHEDEKDDIQKEVPQTQRKERVGFADLLRKLKPQITFKEFLRKHKKFFSTILIVFISLFAVLLGIYIYGCCTITPPNVMGRNVYIENIKVSGLTYDEALIKVKNAQLLNDRDITVTSHGKTFIIDGVEAGLTARIEDTVDKAMRYGKTKNIFLDGFANALQYFVRRTVLPSADVNEPVIRQKLLEFGNEIYGELVQHKLEVGDTHIICTPGHTGFSGNTDEAYKQITDAINDERFSNIYVTLLSAPPSVVTLSDLDAFAYANPQDARFEIQDGQITIIPDVCGRYLNLDEAKELITLLREGGEIIKIPYYKTEAQIKESDLSSKLFNGTIASYSTLYGGSTANRSANIARAASLINEKVLLPGDVLSFNETVGPRSEENGFYPAPEYANGETVMGIGGGTCQVTTTLYNAVLYADLGIVSRLNHMFPVGYAPIGQDATVSDSGVDFKFTNNMDYPIKITTSAQGGKITVNIIGTLRDVPHTVKMENITKDTDGNKSVRSYRYVYDPNNTLIRKDDLGRSYYMAHP